MVDARSRPARVKHDPDRACWAPRCSWMVDNTEIINVLVAIFNTQRRYQTLEKAALAVFLGRYTWVPEKITEGITEPAVHSRVRPTAVTPVTPQSIQSLRM